MSVCSVGMRLRNKMDHFRYIVKVIPIDFYAKNVELGLCSGSAKAVQIWILIRNIA